MIINKDKTVNGLKLWDLGLNPVSELKPLCRKIAAEGSVLLENNGVLPLEKGTKIALFGRMQEEYIKSGTGSGGLVNVEKKPDIWESFKENGDLVLDNELLETYKTWVKKNPLDLGHGWATEPWYQTEMPIEKAFAEKLASKNDAAVVIIGRTAGEDKDNANEKGSYRLTDEEELILENVTSSFNETVVILNVGNIIDLSFIDKYKISAVLYCWQGGQEGANALVDILSGKISPSGKLPDTQLLSIDSHPALGDFKNSEQLVYKDDIYVGYRYFETFEPEKVRYPFGFGLTYTKFNVNCSATEENGIIKVTAEVKNIGDFTAREVVQVYYGAPCGKLGTPVKQLAGFKKTRDLKSGESENLTISFPISQMASYDDSGITGNKSCYILESGEYKIYVGTDVKSAEEVLSYRLDNTVVTEQLEEAMTAETSFERIIATDNNGERKIAFSATPVRENDIDERIINRRADEIAYTGDKGIKLIDVADGKNSMEEFVAQLSDSDLVSIVCGEGMDSPKVTAGTGGSFGGVIDSLLSFGIPICCVSDGPSGIRVGNNYKTTSMPNGYVFASSFDTELTEKIFEYEGAELFAYNIDAILGPGMNIHRHPLCGRNFEYFSEDPLLTGKIAAAQTRGVAKSGCSTTIKHFCCNNQETSRNFVNALVSERALREIYLKGFEIAVKEGGATAIMTSYNPVNGYFTASNYDLTTTILRNEWGYKGFVMTDWWAKANCKNGEGTKENLKAMVRAQNDVYMVCPIAEEKTHNIYEGLKEGYIVRSDLQRCAINLLRYIIKSPTFEKYIEGVLRFDFSEQLNEAEMENVAVLQDVKSGDSAELEFGSGKTTLIVFEVASNAESVAQSSIIAKVDKNVIISFSISL